MNKEYFRSSTIEDNLRLEGIIRDKVFIGPRNVAIHLTNVCNYDCLFCWFHSKLLKRKNKPRYIKFDVFKNIIDDCYSLGVKEIVFIGQGEPFLHPRVYDMIDYVKKKKFILSFDTNGSFNRDKITTVAKVDTFVVNLSAATEKMYRRLQCMRPSAFHGVIKNIEILSRIKQITGSPRIKIVFMITTLNFTEIKNIINLGIKYNVDYIEFRLIFARPEMKKIILSADSAKRLNSTLRELIEQKAPYIQKTNIEGLYKITSMINFKNYFVTNLPKLQNDQERILYYKADFKKNFRCYMGWFWVTINMRGNVYSCCHHHSLGAGNIYRASLKEIWEGKKFSKIRCKLKYSFNIKDKFWQRCHYCSNLEFIKSISQKLKDKLHHYNTPDRLNSFNTAEQAR